MYHTGTMKIKENRMTRPPLDRFTGPLQVTTGKESREDLTYHINWLTSVFNIDFVDYILQFKDFLSLNSYICSLTLKC